MYREDVKSLDNHIKNTVNTGYGMKDVQHLGGAASLKKELEEKCMGEACKFKNDLAPIIGMINDDMTDLQVEMVEDRLHAMRQKVDMITDAGQKAEAQKWYGKAMKEFEAIEHGQTNKKPIAKATV